MIKCKALVLCHMNFQAKDGKKIEKTKLLITLGDFGFYEVLIPLDNSLKEFSTIDVNVSYQYNKFVVDSILK